MQRWMCSWDEFNLESEMEVVDQGVRDADPV